jgi:SRSO17 transposase
MAYELDCAGQHRLDRYFDGIGGILGRKDRRESFALYAMGLFGDGERKSVEPIASRACGDPGLCRAYHDRLLHFVGVAPWSDAAVREYAAHYGVDAMMAREPVSDWIVDDTGFPKQGDKSPGVQRQ